MPLSKVSGVVWWAMGISHYKAVFRRAHLGETEAGYTKDYLQGPRAVAEAFRGMFDGAEPPYEPLTYVWPGGSFDGGKVYKAADYDANGRIEVGQWTGARAPHPWRVGNPATDPLITLPGDPDAAIPGAANAQWEAIEDFEPWLVMVQLDGSMTQLHLRTYLAEPPPELLSAGLDRVPAQLRAQMRGRGGLVEGLPELWFDPGDLRDPWRISSDAEPTHVPPPGHAPGTPLGSDYQPANEAVSSIESAPFEVDPDERDRATRAHAVTQNKLAEVVTDRGRSPRSPTSTEPKYDLAWKEPDGTLVVAEVKSVKPANSERQLRLALGQVLRYRSLLAASGSSVRALIALSEAPHDPQWTALCDDLEIGLVWLPDLAEPLSSWLAQ